MKRQFQYSILEMTKRLLQIAKPVKKSLIISTIASITGNVSQMGLMGFGVLTILSCGGYLEHNMPIVYGILTAVSGILIVACRYIEGMISHVGAYGLLAYMRVNLFEKIRSIAPACLMDQEKGDILNIAVSDIETIEYFFAHTIGPMFTVILLPCITLILAYIYNPLFCFVLLPIYIIVSVVFPLLAIKLGRNIGIDYRESLGKMKSMVLESVYGLRDIQIFGYRKRRHEQVQDQNKKVNRAAHGLALHRQIVASAPNFFVYLARILIIFVASYLVSQGTYNPIGTIVISFVATASFSSTFSLTMVVSSLLEAYGAAERLFIIEDTKPEIVEVDHPTTLGDIQTIEFKHTDFSYQKDQRKILNDMNLVIHKGEKIGIVGESGMGKSTIMRLLLRFWNPTNGQILINGIDIKQTSLKELHQRIALLEQTTFLMNDTIASNIALGKPHASMDEIIEAAKKAGIHDFIQTLPEGYQTQMGMMASRVSGGEKQRIGIARAMLVSPDVLIMDEPTSSLDALHEKELLNTLKEAYQQQTVMIISHRMSTLANCDRIIKLENGKAIEL